jgi:hypothetical protein
MRALTMVMEEDTCGYTISYVGDFAIDSEWINV